VRDQTGSYTPAFAGFSVMNAAVLLSLFALRRERRPEAATSLGAPAASAERA
jgi:hypothetical protein